MSGKTGNYILIGMVLGAILGALGGYFFGDIFIQIKFLGTIFLNALKMIVIPLIVASMIVGVTSLGDIRKLGRTTGKTILYYLATTGMAVLIGIILVNIIQPGNGIGSIGNNIPEMVQQSKPTGFSDFIVNLIPSNLISAAAEGSVLPLIVFSLVFGGVLTSIGKKGKPVIDFFVGLNAAIMKIVILIIYFAPIGIIALIGGIVAENRGSLQEIASGLGLYSLTVIIGLLIHGAVVLPLILKFFGKKDPFKYFLNMGQALATAFTTASSSATLPVTIEAVIEKNKVNDKAASFVLPLGATINMDGTALYEAVAAIFIAQAINYPLPIEAQVIIFLTATLASIGAAAIPHAGLVTMVIVLSAVGLPLEGIGFIFVVDWFLDRCRTTVNVWGDSIGAAVIGETAEIRGYRIGGSKTTTTTGQKTYSKTVAKKPYRAAKSPKNTTRKYGSKPRVTRDTKPRDDKRYQRPTETPQKSEPQKSIIKDSSYDKKPVQRTSAPPKTGKPYVKTNGDRPTIKKEPFQLSKKTIEQDLEKVHRQLSENARSKKPTMAAKDITQEPKASTKSIDKTDLKKNEFFENGVPKFNFFDNKKTTNNKPAEKKPDPTVDSKKSEDIDKKDNSDVKSQDKAIVSDIPVITIPSEKAEKSQDDVIVEQKKPIVINTAKTDKSSEAIDSPKEKPAEQKPPEENISAPDKKTIEEKPGEKPVEKSETKAEEKPEVKPQEKDLSKSETKQDQKADMGWGRDKKKRLSK